MYKGKKILAVIPARGGSKGIYLKNIVKLRKKTLIEHLKHTIDRTKYLIDKTIFSSDNDKIINHAKKIGFKVLLKRPKKLSGDNVDVSKVLVHALNFLEQKEKKRGAPRTERPANRFSPSLPRPATPPGARQRLPVRTSL